MMSRSIMASMQQADDSPSFMERAEQLMRERQEEELENLDKLFEYMDRFQKPVLIFGRGFER